MIRRIVGPRIAGALGLAAVIAAGPALASPALAAGTPGYVGIVISGHGSYCVRWKAGITGDAVLNKVARVAYRNDGLIVQLDGDPSSGTADASHFWSYWHDTSGSWTYSNFGASGYDPRAGSVEGWSYDDGKSSPPKPAQNPSGLYATMCGALDSSRGGGGAPRTTSAHAPRSTSPKAPTTTNAPRHRTARTSTPAVSDGAHAGPTSSIAPSGAPSRSGGSRSAAPRHAAPGDATASRTPATDPAATSSGSDVVAVSGRRRGRAGTVADSSSGSTGSPVGLIVGAGLVIVLGAGAGAVALRRRGAGG